MFRTYVTYAIPFKVRVTSYVVMDGTQAVPTSNCEVRQLSAHETTKQ
jgi:hypothetical protein